MLFNDDFLEEEYTSLPRYKGTEILPVRLVSTGTYRQASLGFGVLWAGGGGKWAVGEPALCFRQAVAKEGCD